MLQSIRRWGAVAPLLFVALFAMPADHAAETAEHQLCSSCHLGHLGESPTAADADTTVSRCVTCHADIGTGGSDLVPRNAGLPGGAPAVHADCAACHAPHGNGRPFQLMLASGDGVPVRPGGMDDVSRLCQSCHPEHTDTRGPRGHFIRHPVGLPLAAHRRTAAARLGLPLVDTGSNADPADDVLSCITCHEVHGGSGTHSLRWSAGSESAVCRGCHAVDGPPGPFVARSGF